MCCIFRRDLGEVIIRVGDLLHSFYGQLFRDPLVVDMRRYRVHRIYTAAVRRRIITTSRAYDMIIEGKACWCKYIMVLGSQLTGRCREEWIFISSAGAKETYRRYDRIASEAHARTSCPVL